MLLRHVLIVDDHDPDLRYAEIIFRSANIAEQVVLVRSGQEALDYMQSSAGQRVDAILLDINMPEMSGFDFLQLYQPLVQQGVASAPVLIHTSSSAQSDRQQASQYPCVKGYLVKPLTRLAVLELPKVLGDKDSA